MNKTTKQLAILGLLVAVILIVIIWIVTSGGAGDFSTQQYRLKTVSTELSSDIFVNPAYAKLQSSVTLPLSPGPMGRENPFQPYQGQ